MSCVLENSFRAASVRLLLGIGLLSSPLAVFHLEARAGQLEGMKEFQDGTPAIAADVNTNNLILSNKTQDLEARITQLEDVSPRLIREDEISGSGRAGVEAQAGAGGMVELVGGKRIITGIDCSQDPHALNKAYQRNIRFSYLEFVISGECYGHFTLLDGEGVMTGGGVGEVQEHGQVVSISSDFGMEGGVTTKPKLVPHPVTQYSSLVGSFGGGLYINNVDIDVVASTGWGVLFSRGTTGDLANSTVTCKASENTVSGVIIQNGAAPYLMGVTINDCDQGILSFGNTAVSVFGDIDINGARLGVALYEGASFGTRRFRPVINIEASEAAVLLSGVSSMFVGDEGAAYGVMEWSGGISVSSGSYLEALYPVRWSGSLDVQASAVRISPLKTTGDPDIASDYLTASDVNPSCRGPSIVNIVNRVSGEVLLPPDPDCEISM